MALRLRAEREDYLPLLPKLEMPTLIVVGDQDQFTPLSDAEWMHHGIRNSKLVVIQDAGHVTNMEQPVAFNTALALFLQAIA